MTAFAASVATLFRDPNLSQPALWRAGGEGPGAPVRVMRRAADETSAFGDARIVRPAMRVDVRAAQVSAPALGDTVEIAGEMFEVAGAPQRDAERLVWTLPLRPVAGGGA